MGKSGRARGVRTTRNPEILPGVGLRKYGRALANRHQAKYKFSKKGLGKKYCS